MNKYNCSIGKTYKNGQEVFTWRRFRGGFFGLLDPIGWAKDLIGLFNVRKLVLYAIILVSVGTYFYVQGRGETPVRLNLNYKEEFVLNLNGEYLHKPKNSNDLYIKDRETNKILKHVKAKDFPLLRKKLAPLGFQLQPIFVGGIGIGEKGIEGEVGMGVSVLRYWKMQLEAFLTNYGIYVGTSYSITDNSGAGIAGGMGYKGDQRIILYYRFNF